MEWIMPAVLYSGKLPWRMKPVLFMNNVLTWMLGNTRDTGAMKERVKRGYEGAVTDDVFRYDDFGLEHYTKIARKLVEDTDLKGKKVLDVGCGTGILSMVLMERGAKKVVCGDISENMLEQCRKKVADTGYDVDCMEFEELDSESLPFGSNYFDVVVSSMLLELLPDPKRAVAEMVRVVKPGGTIALSTHGPEHYYELIDASLSSLRLAEFMHFLGYRFEIWQMNEAALRKILNQTGLVDIRTGRFKWQEDFRDGGEAYDFFVGTSSAYWYERIPQHKRADFSERSRKYFESKNVRSCEMDVTLGYGRKPD
jgi:ubiquinone/menaquinone biosynthesis C-methylase UbiE